MAQLRLEYRLGFVAVSSAALSGLFSYCLQARAVDPEAKMPLGMATPLWGMPGFEPWLCFQLKLPLTLREAAAGGSLMWDTWIKFLAPVLELALSRLLLTFEK